MKRHPVPQQFTKRLHETIAWCAPRVNINDPKYCLRSAQLRPEYEFSSRPEDDVDLWADLHMINKVVASRSQLLSPTRPLPTGAGNDLAGGRLLIHFLDESNHNGLTADLTSYFLDNNDTPPWDTWVQAFIPEPLAHESPDSLPSVYAFLISWVPPEFLEAVHEATEAECVGMLMWADAPRRWERPLYKHADSIPIWLQQLAPVKNA
jgi:hypothetical protein